MKKNESICSIVLYFLSSIMMILLAIRVAMTYVLEGLLLVFYIILAFVTIYIIIGNGIKIYREHKEN